MRFIGNKNKLAEQLEAFVYANVGQDFTTFCDLFSGTGTVGGIFADKHTIIANDVLASAYIVTSARLNPPANVDFDGLGLDPFELFNNPASKLKGFIAKNYAPEESGRMYFSNENAQRIDFIRTSIETWRGQDKLTEYEYTYLLACLLEAVSKVANIAGVYGAYLKHWDPRALKTLQFTALPFGRQKGGTHEVMNEDSLRIIERVQGDVLYLDPPYTKNDYFTQYHLLETIAKYDNPAIKGITGGREDTKKSAFSSLSSAQAAFEKIIAEAKFDHIVISYSNKGLMSKDFITRCLKKYAVADSFKLEIINHRNYTNHQSARDESLEEYVFYIQKQKQTYIESPLNYMGSKFGVVRDIMEFANCQPTTFVDVFGGGFNVGLNSLAPYLIYNDVNFFVRDIVEMFYKQDGAELLQQIQKIIKKHHLAKSDKEAFVAFRNYYNTSPKRSTLDLYVLLQYGFQQQFRFNSAHGFNNTVGMSSFNDSTALKVLSFSRTLKNKQVSFHSIDFATMLETTYDNPLYYCDPPYLVTLGSYNDGKRGFKGWTEADEKRLYEALDAVHARGEKFVLSNILEHKGKVNTILKQWIKNEAYTVKEVYSKNRVEIIVKNFS